MEFSALFQNGFTSLNQNRDCNNIWSSFSSTFANQDPNTISAQSYENYFDMFPINGKRNTFLFWSQTIELAGMLSCMCEAADVFSGPNYFPVAIMDKVASELVMPMTDLRWCGTTDNNTGVSEKCGQGSLVKLRQRIEKRDIGYSCYDVFGYPVNTDPTLVELTECAANIITAQQQNLSVKQHGSSILSLFALSTLLFMVLF